MPTCMKCGDESPLGENFLNAAAAWGSLMSEPTESIGVQISRAFLEAAKKHAYVCAGPTQNSTKSDGDVDDSN